MSAEGAEECAVAGAGLEDAAGGLKMVDEAPCQLRRRLDIVVADIVAIGLGASLKPESFNH